MGSIRSIIALVSLAVSGPLIQAQTYYMPVVLNPIFDRYAGQGETETFDVTEIFAAEPVDSQMIELDTTQGTIRFALFNQSAPVTVANIKDYVEDGSFDDMFFHRTVPGFVLQGGGFRFDLDGDGSIVAVDKKDPIVNEFRISNSKYTLSMAKIGGDPDSATSEFFINYEENSYGLVEVTNQGSNNSPPFLPFESPNLDIQNDGFTVFARLLPSSFDLIEDWEAFRLATFGNGAAPFDDENGDNQVAFFELILMERVRLRNLDTSEVTTNPALTYSLESVTPAAGADVSLVGNTLTVNYAEDFDGEVSVVVRAADASGAFVDETFKAFVVSPFLAWRANAFTRDEIEDLTISGPDEDPDGDGFTNIAEYALGLNPKAVDGAPYVRNSIREATGDGVIFTIRRRMNQPDATFAFEAAASPAGPWVAVAHEVTDQTINGSLTETEFRVLRPTGNPDLPANGRFFVRSVVTVDSDVLDEID